MKRSIVFIVSLACLILAGFLVYNISFPKVSFNCIYDGVAEFSNLKPADYKNFEKQNVYIFTTKRDWDEFKNKYLGDGQIPDLTFDKGQILLSYTDLDLNKGGKIYEIDDIHKNILSLDIKLKEKGFVDSLSGFRKDANPKNIMIYNINAGILANVYSAKIE